MLQNLCATVFLNLGNDFDMTDISRVDIRPVRDADKDTPPGYYQDGVFYYSFHNGRFLRRSMEWLFTHEAIPGHHYQMEISRISGNRPAVRALFWYPGFSEGWAAYAEDLGKDIGCYRDPYQYLGKGNGTWSGQPGSSWMSAFIMKAGPGIRLSDGGMKTFPIRPISPSGK